MYWLVFLTYLALGAVAETHDLTNRPQIVLDLSSPNPSTQDAVSQGLFPMAHCRGVTLEEVTIDQLQAYMSEGFLTSVDILQCYLARYEQVNNYTAAIIQLNPDAMQIARTLDAERKGGKVRGPLHGIPCLVKDNMATKDKMDTTAGSWALQGSVVPRDAYVVKRLREAGALLIGHASLSEWASMRSTNYSEGYSPKGGQARSPYNLTVNPGGSSAGSAIAVAANQAMFALGTSEHMKLQTTTY